MKIKVDVNTINRIIDPKYPIDKLYNQLKGLHGQTGLVFGEPSVGSGQLLWTLEGEDWIAFSDLEDQLKPQASVLFKDRKNLLKEILKGSELSDALLTLPDEKYLYFRNLESRPEIGLACWGYRYPHFKEGIELETWINKANLQEVVVSFSWNGEKLANYPFKFNTFQRQTDSNGVFIVDQPLPVGKSYSVTSKDGRTFTLTVTKGKRDYDFDLTKFFTVEITIEKDEESLENKDLTLKFNGDSRQLKTDSNGNVQLRLPFVCTEDGVAEQPQPDCIVVFDDKTESQIPSEVNDHLFFFIQFTTPLEENVEEIMSDPPEEEPEEEEEVPEISQMIGITVLDYGGYPVREMEVTLIMPTKKEARFVTDENGRIEFPKDWMQGKKGKIKVRFVATSEYQKTHDLHMYEKSNKDKKQS